MELFELTEFEKKVLGFVKTIKPGEVKTYAQVARSIGHPRSARAVGNALNKNPHIIEIPCHRVVRSDMLLGGYVKGTKEKEKLLKLEGLEIRHKKIVNAP